MEILVTRSSTPWISYWSLKVYGKTFFLGQDVKVCHRILGMGPRDVIKVIGSNDISKKTVNTKLARFICNSLNLDRSTAKHLQNWQLACE